VTSETRELYVKTTADRGKWTVVSGKNAKLVFLFALVTGHVSPSTAFAPLTLRLRGVLIRLIPKPRVLLLVARTCPVSPRLLLGLKVRLVRFLPPTNEAANHDGIRLENRRPKMLVPEEQIEALYGELGGKPKFAVLVVCILGDVVSHRVSFRFEGVLKRAGWNTDTTEWAHSRYGGMFVGVADCTRPAPGAQVLFDALKRSGIPIGDDLKRFPHDTDDRCCLFIGTDPLLVR
jgi:hypothetical protein